MISVEKANRRQYDKDMERYDCGYWSVCEDHACACAISDNVDGFDNEVYQEMKEDLQKQTEMFYEEERIDSDFYSDPWDDNDDLYDDDEEFADYWYDDDDEE